MSDTGEGDPRALARLRERIDTIDAEMHRLLVERGAVIDSLIKTKGTSRPGAAFRPMREADMMRRFAKRHSGALPLATVEHIWREIITTFTNMQAPFGVVADMSVEPDRMRDLARFTFGFSVELKAAASAAAVVAAVAGANDLGLIARAARGPWWRGLVGPDAPKIMALLPFIAAQQRPADLPAFVISPPLADPTPFDITVVAMTVDGTVKSIDGVELLQLAENDALVAAPAAVDLPELNARFEKAGVAVRTLSPVGGFARGVTADGRATAFYAEIS
ncbi:MAG TPA: chorismate mutase [Bauldia sp.]|nr:chorismate mutase [Bauldia sp.]